MSNPSSREILIYALVAIGAIAITAGTVLTLISTGEDEQSDAERREAYAAALEMYKEAIPADFLERIPERSDNGAEGACAFATSFAGETKVRSTPPGGAATWNPTHVGVRFGKRHEPGTQGWACCAEVFLDVPQERRFCEVGEDGYLQVPETEVQAFLEEACQDVCNPQVSAEGRGQLCHSDASLAEVTLLAEPVDWSGRFDCPSG